MTGNTLTRQQRRRIERYADAVGKVTQGDRLFFERFPHRRHRVRLASRAEIAQNDALAGHACTPGPDHRAYVAVRQAAPGIRLRIFIAGPADADTDMDEADARMLYEAFAAQEAGEIEKQLLEADRRS